MVIIVVIVIVAILGIPVIIVIIVTTVIIVIIVIVIVLRTSQQVCRIYTRPPWTLHGVRDQGMGYSFFWVICGALLGVFPWKGPKP